MIIRILGLVMILYSCGTQNHAEKGIDKTTSDSLFNLVCKNWKADAGKSCKPSHSMENARLIVNYFRINSFNERIIRDKLGDPEIVADRKDDGDLLFRYILFSNCNQPAIDSSRCSLGFVFGKKNTVALKCE